MTLFLAACLAIPDPRTAIGGNFDGMEQAEAVEHRASGFSKGRMRGATRIQRPH